MSAAGDLPCGGDAYRDYHTSRGLLEPSEPRRCRFCLHWHGVCLGASGYAFFLPVAVEVAGERAETLRLTAVAMRQNGIRSMGGTVTDVTLYPGPDPRLVQDDWGRDREFPGGGER